MKFNKYGLYAEWNLAHSEKYTEFVFDFRKNFAFADNIRNDIVHMLIIRGMTFNSGLGLSARRGLNYVELGPTKDDPQPGRHYVCTVYSARGGAVYTRCK